VWERVNIKYQNARRLLSQDKIVCELSNLCSLQLTNRFFRDNIVVMMPIVLTGTIIPNDMKSTHRDWEVRRREYLDAIKYYKKFSKVYFLENSDYDLSHDADFAGDERLQCFKFRASRQFKGGKGHQEFQMLDEFVKHKLNDDRFVKVTGRYIYENFDELFSFILREERKYDLIIDAIIRSRIAVTSLFYVKKATYLQCFQNSYLEMDDSEGIYAEHVIYRALKKLRSYTFFPKLPLLNAVQGTSGLRIMVNDCSAKSRIKNLQRILFLFLRMKRLLV